MLSVTKKTETTYKIYNCCNESNPYRLIMDVIAQENWPLDMVSFFRNGHQVIARLDRSDKPEIIVYFN